MSKIFIYLVMWGWEKENKKEKKKEIGYSLKKIEFNQIILYFIPKCYYLYFYVTFEY